MGTAEDNDATVRIEFSADEGAIAAVDGDRPDGGRWGTLAAIGLAIVVVGGLVLALRPESGQTAAGEPIVVPTSVPEDDTASAEGVTNEDPDVTTNPGTDGAVANDVDDLPYEQVESDVFLLSVVDADLGWIALALSDASGGGQLVRSIDGLNWDPLPVDDLPTGDVLGLDRLGDTYVIAVDERRSWSESGFGGGDGELPEHHIRLYTSLDAVNWFESELPALEGQGFPFLVSFTADSYVVPMQRATEDTNVALIDFLAPFVDAEVAAQVCESRRDFSDSDRAVLLLDCDGQDLARVIAADHPDDFENLWPTYCVESAREVGLEEFALAMVERGGDTHSVDISETPAVFGRAVPGGYLARAGAIVGRQLPEECGGPSFDPSEAGARAVPLIFWDPDEGVSIVTPEDQAVSGANFGPDGAIAKTTDEKIIAIVNDSVFGGTQPFDSWQRITGPPEQSGEIPTGFGEVSLTHDGRAAGLYARGEGSRVIWITRDFSTWRPFSLDVFDSFSARLVVAADEYVVISVEGERSPLLVKIPFAA